jgi:gamma-glutamyl-gamma-aminobutyrate hydrolase PuuD
MKRIGIVGWKTGDNSFGATVPYLRFFSQFGVVEIIMPNETDIREDLDLLVLPGGPDVDPMRYLTENDALSFDMGKQCPFRERFDQILLPKYIDQRVPLFGIN